MPSSEPDVAVGVLTGAGGTFCAGADLQAMSGPNANRVEPDGDGPMGPTRMLTAKPVVAAVEGYAVAGGLELALWCDLRVAARDAVFGVFCRRWGVPLIDGGTVRLPRLVGLSHALDLILTGRGVAGEEAARIGLVSFLVEKDAFDGEVTALARRLASGPVQAYAQTKALLTREQDMSLSAAIELEAMTQALLMKGEDYAEFHIAFNEGRPPQWTGR